MFTKLLFNEDTMGKYWNIWINFKTIGRYNLNPIM